MDLLAKIVTASMPAVPRPIMRRLAARYIAGEQLDDAIARLTSLAKSGFSGIIDLLGEDVEDEREARAAHAAYRAAATAIHANGLDAYVSVKPTHFGLRVSPDLAHELYEDLLQHCAPLDQMVRVEMEDHTVTDLTLALFRELRADHENVGIVLQSRLFRTTRDIAELPPASDVRLVKGIYIEPHSIAHTEPEPIREAFVSHVEALASGGHHVALATHDEDLADRSLAVLAERGIAPERYVFEVLLGVRMELWNLWRDAGQRVLVYVPYGPEWRAYSQRRLKKNPEVLKHVIRNVFGASG